MTVSLAATPTHFGLETYLAEFDQHHAAFSGSRLTWLQNLRREALDCFKSQGFPTIRDENWKYTNLTTFTKKKFAYGQPASSSGIANDIFLFPQSSRLVFINGHFHAALSNLKELPPGVILTNLASAWETQSSTIQAHLNRLAHSDNAFMSLNTSFMQDGTLLFLPDNCQLKQPLELVFIHDAATQQSFSMPRNLLIVGKNSQAVILERFLSMGDQEHFCNSLTELFLEQNSRVEYYKVLQENSKAFHVDQLQVKQEQTSELQSYSLTLNGGLTRSDINILLTGEHSASFLHGLYLGKNKHHIDHHTTVDHAVPHGKSVENYQGVLADHARAVFNGKVIVRPNAFQSTAQQLNKNLLLSKEAEIDTKPELEIYNDDVRCTHGATVGQLNPDSMFYLQSRGIDENTAKQILVQAFVREMIQNIPAKNIRDHLEQFIGQQP